MPPKIIKLPFRGTFFPYYREFLSGVFNNYIPGTIQTLQAHGTEQVIEKISYVVPKEEYQLFLEYIPQKERVTSMPASTRWIEVEFVGNDEYDPSYSNIYFHDKPIREFDLYAHPHLFSPSERDGIAANLQSFADRQYGKGKLTIVNVNESFRGKRLWIYNAVTECNAVVASMVSAIRRGLHRKGTIGGFTRVILAETHILTCDKKLCAEFRNDWKDIITNRSRSSWDLLYARNEKTFRKWNIINDPPL